MAISSHSPVLVLKLLLLFLFSRTPNQAGYETKAQKPNKTRDLQAADRDVQGRFNAAAQPQALPDTDLFVREESEVFALFHKLPPTDAALETDVILSL